MALLEHDLWSSVTKGARHGREHFIFGVEHLGDTEIGKYKGRRLVSGEIEEVFRF
jgi:hypothetical protein